MTEPNRDYVASDQRGDTTANADYLTSTKRRLSAVLLLAVLAGCSIDSTPANVDHMHCIKAHDEFHQTDGGGVTTVCDQYVPDKPLPTVTVTETP